MKNTLKIDIILQARVELYKEQQNMSMNAWDDIVSDDDNTFGAVKLPGWRNNWQANVLGIDFKNKIDQNFHNFCKLIIKKN